MKKLYFEIKQHTNKPLKADLYLSNNDANSEAKAINIIIHGFKGFRSWGFIPLLAENLSEKVGPTITIDFSLDGTEDKGSEVVYNNDDFRRNTISQMLEELKSILDFIYEGKIKDKLNCRWNNKINLIGHSMGGALSVITAYEDPRVSKICIWGTPSKLIWNTDRQKADWREKGYVEIKIPSTGQVLNLDVAYLEDKENNAQRFDLISNISKINIPICIIHGKQDFTVKIHSAEELRDSAINNPNLEYHIIEKCNHVFNTSHPAGKMKVQLEQAIKFTNEFLSEN